MLENVDVPFPVMIRADVSIGPANVEVDVFVTARFVIDVEPRFDVPETVKLEDDALERFV